MKQGYCVNCKGVVEVQHLKRIVNVTHRALEMQVKSKLAFCRYCGERVKNHKLEKKHLARYLRKYKKITRKET